MGNHAGGALLCRQHLHNLLMETSDRQTCCQQGSFPLDKNQAERAFPRHHKIHSPSSHLSQPLHIPRGHLLREAHARPARPAKISNIDNSCFLPLSIALHSRGSRVRGSRGAWQSRGGCRSPRCRCRGRERWLICIQRMGPMGT